MRWDREKRQAYYSDVRLHRGESGLQALIEEVKRQWARRS